MRGRQFTLPPASRTVPHTDAKLRNFCATLADAIDAARHHPGLPEWPACTPTETPRLHFDRVHRNPARRPLTTGGAGAAA